MTKNIDRITVKPSPPLKNFLYGDLFNAAGLEQLDQRFLGELERVAPDLCSRLRAYRGIDTPMPAAEVSGLLLALAPHLERFIAELFRIESDVAAVRGVTEAENTVQRFKKHFVQRRARRYRGTVTHTFAELDAWLAQAVPAGTKGDRELAVSRFAVGLLEDPDTNTDAIERLTQWCILARKEPEAMGAVAGWTSFHLPRPVDPARLVPLDAVPGDAYGRLQHDPTTFRRRDGFNLTDPRMSTREIQDQVDYCAYCHENEGDFCSKGFPRKKGEPELGFKTNPLGVTLTGCPLEEKISEMHTLKRDGHPIGALAMIMVDNPMVPATGHRICNDCMKACIFQKQEPVNIPQTETGTLTDVLHLPWGVEIYDLLTRWNPLRRSQYRMQPYNGHKVLVSGMGPAGFTMAHHLTMEGCAVVGIDGLKIEPLPEELLTQPVRDYDTLVENLDERVLNGFGGVAEYGITVRWDKNFLKLIYLSLARRAHFQVFGGVRLGGTVTLEDAWRLGFDHVCIANGAGLPHVIPMGNSLARGMRQANDFLMALQLTGAAKGSSLASLQVRLPAVVIGGGLTAVDTATEVQAYYIKQVEKILARYEQLTAAHGADHVEGQLDAENRASLAEFLEHGRAVRAERERARAGGEAPDFVPLLRRWGGVTLAYRRGLNESPAYLRNHEEITQAMAEGIYYAEALEPVRVELDQYGHVTNLVCHRRRHDDGWWVATDTEVKLPARAVLVAAGSTPNTLYEREYPGTLTLQGNHFQPYAEADGALVPVEVGPHCKVKTFGPFTTYDRNHHRVSFIGDTHPVFHGSVVKAIASAKRSYPLVMESLERQRAGNRDDYATFRATMNDLLTPRVTRVDGSHPSVVELWVRAPLAARNFRPGQFFRLQTFERLSPVVDGTRLQIPLQTVSGAGVAGDEVRLVVLKGGPNPRLAERLVPGQPLVLMGPTGAPADVESGRTILVAAGKWGAAAMLDLGPALRAAGNRVLMFGAFPRADDIAFAEELEAGTDQIVWCTASGATATPRRPQDASVTGGDLIDLLRRYGDGEIAPASAGIRLEDVDEILVMGSTGLLRGFQHALKNSLAPYFRDDIKATGTVGSPMQCMLKGVCAQCLQWQIDPSTGERTEAVFSCAQQDQSLFAIDVDNLAARQSQNRLSDHLNGLWLNHVLENAAAND